MPLPNDQVVYVTEAVSGRSAPDADSTRPLANMEIDPLDRSALRSWFEATAQLRSSPGSDQAG